MCYRTAVIKEAFLYFHLLLYENEVDTSWWQHLKSTAEVFSCIKPSFEQMLDITPTIEDMEVPV